jgi:hypothetical protein
MSPHRVNNLTESTNCKTKTNNRLKSTALQCHGRIMWLLACECIRITTRTMAKLAAQHYRRRSTRKWTSCRGLETFIFVTATVVDSPLHSTPLFSSPHVYTALRFTRRPCGRGVCSFEWCDIFILVRSCLNGGIHADFAHMTYSEQILHAHLNSRIWDFHGGEYEYDCLLGCSDRPEDGDNKDLWNVGKLLPGYTALQPRIQPSSHILTL